MGKNVHLLLQKHARNDDPASRVNGSKTAFHQAIILKFRENLQALRKSVVQEERVHVKIM